MPARPTPPSTTPDLPTLLTIDQAADRIGMSPRYVRRLIAERRIVSYRLGRAVRIDPADLAAHVHAGRIEPITTTTCGPTSGGPPDMANKSGHRRFGNLRKRDSGRWQARYLGPDGRLRSAPQTFARKEEAERWLTLAEAQMMRGDWIDPSLGRVAFAEYAENWLRERPRLRPRTVELYELLLRRHINPALGAWRSGN